MKYIDQILGIIKQIFVFIWNALSLFFGFTYEKQGRKMKDYDVRGKTNAKRKSTVYRANKVSKD
jgi:hypothetical protein